MLNKYITPLEEVKSLSKKRNIAMIIILRILIRQSLGL